MQKVGVKKSMLAGSFCDSLWILAQLAPSLKSQWKGADSDLPWYFSNGFIYTTNLVGSVTSGLGSSLLWVAQGKFISDCANEKSKGFFFGYFWAIYMAS